MLKQSLYAQLDRSVDAMIDRYLAVNHQWVVGGHHFAHASTECIHLYRDGYFLSCVMATQAVNEGIAGFVAERNNIAQLEREKKADVVRRMTGSGLVSESFCNAFLRIQGSYRNALHHMNPPVATIDLDALAKRNIFDLATIEREIFECDTRDGLLVPKHPQYWDIRADGSVLTNLRCS